MRACTHDTCNVRVIESCERSLARAGLCCVGRVCRLRGLEAAQVKIKVALAQSLAQPQVKIKVAQPLARSQVKIKVAQPFARSLAEAGPFVVEA